MILQEHKDKADIIAKYGEVIYKKLIILSAIAGGSWLFGIKEVGIESYFALIAFGLSSVGVVVNLFRLGETARKLKDIER